jgi:methylenetetrahydrofolate--tRNA-(uracil-5-)-methyltransferase
MHRNTFINSPDLLDATMRFKGRTGLYFAGQIVGTEGYVGSTASGLVAGINAARMLLERSSLTFPRTTMLGALLGYVSTPQEKRFQPMKPNFGIIPPLDPPVRKKRDRYAAFAKKSEVDLETFIAAEGVLDDLDSFPGTL